MKAEADKFIFKETKKISNLKDALNQYFLTGTVDFNFCRLKSEDKRVLEIIFKRNKPSAKKTNEQKWKFIFQKVLNFLKRKLINSLEKLVLESD